MSARVWVTRDEEPGGDLCSALSAAGLEPVLEPVLRRSLVADPASIVGSLSAKDWLVITSAFAARSFTGVKVAARVAVVGEVTAKACRTAGLDVELVAGDGTAASLWPILWRRIGPGGRVCYPRSSLAEIPAATEGVRLDAPILYRTEPRPFDHGVASRVDVAALTSPSAARRLVGLPALPPCASIGPTTSAAMRAAGLPVWTEAAQHTFDGLAAAIVAKLRTPARP